MIPFYDDLVARHPDLELVFRVRTAPGQRYADTDAEIFFNGGGSLPPGAQWLIGDRFWVVAHPSLMPEAATLEDVVAYPLLQHAKVGSAWDQLAERRGINLAATRFHYYEQYGLIIDASLQRLGIAIVPRFLVRDLVDCGQLRQIGSEIEFPEMGYHYQLVRPEASAVSRKFFSWLKTVADTQA